MIEKNMYKENGNILHQGIGAISYSPIFGLLFILTRKSGYLAVWD
jgi:hypothetical protein